MSRINIPNSSSQAHINSNSFSSSKNQTPMKSPSPDHAHMNALTPTKVKYFIDQSKNVKGYQFVAKYNSCNQTPNKVSYKQEKVKISQNCQQQSRKDVYSSMNNRREEYHDQYIKNLQQRINILQIENKNLFRKLTQQKQNKLNHSPLSVISGNQSNNYGNSNQNRGQLTNISQNRRTQIMAKIKQQYQQKVNTLKLMVEQQIKQAIGVIEDMCEIMKNKIIGIQARFDKIQEKISRVKMDKILKIEDGFNRTINISGTGMRLNNSRKQFLGFNMNSLGQNSLSDILCVSIPEQQQEQSKNYTITISKLQQQIENLKKTICEAHNLYKEQKVHLTELLSEKNNEILSLKTKLEQSERKKHSIQWKYNKSIKQELKLLQKNVNEIGQQLIRSQNQYQIVVKVLQQKSNDYEKIEKQVIELKEKQLNHQKQKIFYEEKIRYLQNNLQILEQQLKQRKILLNQAILSKTALQKERIMKLNNQTQKYSTQRNVLTLTSRIDKLLKLQKQRENVQKQLYENYKNNKIQNQLKNSDNIHQIINQVNENPLFEGNINSGTKSQQNTRQKQNDKQKQKQQQTMIITGR